MPTTTTALNKGETRWGKRAYNDNSLEGVVTRWRKRAYKDNSLEQGLR